MGFFMYKHFVLTAKKYNDLDTEIKFSIASARANGTQLVSFELSKDSDEELVGKIHASIQKILRALAKTRVIEFFLCGSSLAEEGMEQEFLKNKFSEYLLIEAPKEYYIKL